MIDQSTQDTLRAYMNMHGYGEWAIGYVPGENESWDGEAKIISLNDNSTVLSGLHTLAHAMLGDDNHDALFRAVAVSIGFDPNVAHDGTLDEEEAIDVAAFDQAMAADAGEHQTLTEVNAELDGQGNAPSDTDSELDGEGAEDKGEPELEKLDNPEDYAYIGHCPKGCELGRKRKPTKELTCKAHGLPVEFAPSPGE